MHRPSVALSLTVLLLAACGFARAQNAYTSRPANVRAGPDREYPVVAQLGPGEPLDVHGCLSDWSWCDVSFEDNRGWVYAGGVSFVYEGQRVPLYSYAPRLGLPIITFSLGTYWDQHYRGRPWYSQRQTWAHRRLPPHMRPAGRPGMGAMQMPHARPEQMPRETRPVMPNAREPDRGHVAPRADERGRPGPPAGRAPEQHGYAPQQHGNAPQQHGNAPQQHGNAPQEHGHAPRSGGPPAERGRSDHGDRDEHGNRPPSSV